jgi:teichoic acid transport system permease protein
MRMLKTILNFISDIIKNKQLIWELVKRDMKSSYTGSFMGILWTFIHPFALTIIFMIIFGFGFRSGSPIEDVPFFIWFLSGYIPWLFFSSSISSNSTCMIEYSFLVKKINFRISIIPLIKTFSNIVILAVYMISLLSFIIIWKVPISIYYLQMIYYFFALLLLIMGSSYLLSSSNIFIRDIGNVNQILLHLGFFATPIFWRIEDISTNVRFLLKLNPMYYIVNGFRDSLFNKIPFWHNMFDTIYFWGITGIIVIFGVLVFVKLRPHFSDVV